MTPTQRSGRRPSTYRPLTSKTRCVHRADLIERMRHAVGRHRADAIERMRHAVGRGGRRDVVVKKHGHKLQPGWTSKAMLATTNSDHSKTDDKLHDDATEAHCTSTPHAQQSTSTRRTGAAAGTTQAQRARSIAPDMVVVYCKYLQREHPWGCPCR